MEKVAKAIFGHAGYAAKSPRVPQGREARSALPKAASTSINTAPRKTQAL